MATPNRSHRTIPPRIAPKTAVWISRFLRPERPHEVDKRFGKTGCGLAFRRLGIVVRHLVRRAAGRVQRAYAARDRGEPLDRDRADSRCMGDLLGRALSQKTARKFELRAQPDRGR